MHRIFADFLDELQGRGLSALLGLIVGGVIAWFFARWRRMRERRNILRGDARDTVVLSLHVLESPPGGGPPVLRIRALGQAELKRVVPNGHLAAILLHRAMAVTTHPTLISMVGAEGSYLLKTLTGFVCDRVTNAPFDHDLALIAPSSQ